MRLPILLAAATALTATAAGAQTAAPAVPQPAPTAPQTATPIPVPPTADPLPADPATTPATTATAPAATTPPTLVQPAVGATVLDPAGAKVGTIKALTPQFATITTAKGDVRLPVSGIGPGPNGPVIGGTAAEMEAAAARAATPARPTRRRR